jgi:large conductance mechanosensitive channel
MGEAQANRPAHFSTALVAQPVGAISALEDLMLNMFKGFRDFILRGNVVDLAVAVIIGAAFGAITSSLTADVITPIISALIGAPDFSSLVIHIPVLHHVPPPPSPPPANYIAPGDIHVGKLLNTAINFLLVAAAIYFAIVLPTHYMMKRLQPDAPLAAPTTKPCPECLSEIPLSAKRCAHCTQPVS